MLLSTAAMDATLKKNFKSEFFFFLEIKNRLLRFYAHYNQRLCQKFSARSVKNCMTSMQLCRDHPCPLPACFYYFLIL